MIDALLAALRERPAFARLSATDLAPSGTQVLDVSATARADSFSTERDQPINVTEQEVRA